MVTGVCFLGNHESINMNQMYGFEGEVRSKYSSQMWDLFTEIFNWLPLAHLLESRVLVMRGGLFSRDGVELRELVEIDRNRQPPEEGGHPWDRILLAPLGQDIVPPLGTGYCGPPWDRILWAPLGQDQTKPPLKLAPNVM